MRTYGVLAVVLALVGSVSATNIQNVGIVTSVQDPKTGTSGLAVTADSAGNMYGVGAAFSGIGTGYYYTEYSPVGALLNNGSGYDGGGHATGQYVVVDSAGTMHIAGTSQGFGTDNDWLVFGHGKSVFWNTTVNGSASHSDTPCGIAVDSAGNTYVAGTLNDGPDENATIAVYKFDKDGNVVWSNNAVTTDTNAHATCMALSSDGRMCIGGYSGASGSYSIYIVDSSGQLITSSYYNSSGGGRAVSARTDPKGNFVVTGLENDNNGSQIVVSVTGTVIVTFADNPFPDSIGVDCGKDSSGNVYVLAQYRDVHDQGHSLVIKYDGSQTKKWQQSFAGLSTTKQYAYPAGFAVDKYGDCYVSGNSYFSSIYPDAAFLLKYNTSGQLMFTAYHGVLNAHEVPASLYLDANGDMYTCGSVETNTDPFRMITQHWAQAAIANFDTYSVAHNTTLNVAGPGLMANDTFTHGATAVVKSNPSHGTVTIQTTGAFKYVPTTGFTGTDTFTYVDAKTAGGGYSNVATVTIHVT
jgi:hypothetical protein